MQAGSRRSLAAEYSERAVYVAQGEVEIAGQKLGAGQMLVLPAAGTVDIRAAQNSTVMLLGGEPVGERFIDWNFVSSSKERLAQARADWQAGRMKLPVGDTEEFIPLP